MIPAYSSQARGRSERNSGTWQGRLPQELRLAGIETVEEANRFLRERYIGEFNAKFRVAAAQKGTAFRRFSRTDLGWIFTVQSERVVAKDNTVAIAERSWQLDKSRFRNTLAGSTVTIHEHLDGKVSIRWGPHTVGRFDAHGKPVHSSAKKEHGGRKRLACGSKELESPPFPFPPPGASGVPPPATLRLGHCAGPRHNAHPRSGPVRNKAPGLGAEPHKR
jgi:hypothetical protein